MAHATEVQKLFLDGLNDDVLELIVVALNSEPITRVADLVNLSGVNRLFRFLCLPYLFRRRSISFPASSDAELCRMLDMMARKTVIGNIPFRDLVRDLELNGHLGHPDTDDMCNVTLLVPIISLLENLTTLNLHFFCRKLAKHFLDFVEWDGIKLDKVKRLDPSRRGADFGGIVLACPNIEILTINLEHEPGDGFGKGSALRAATSCAMLRILIMSKEVWFIDNVEGEDIYRVFPLVTNLMLLGQLEERKRSDFIPVLSKFANLEMVALPDKLNVFLDFDYFVGNEFDIIFDRVQNKHHWKEPDVVVARSFFNACESLVGFSNAGSYKEDYDFEGMDPDRWFVDTPDIVLDRATGTIKAWHPEKYNIATTKRFDWTGQRTGRHDQNRVLGKWPLVPVSKGPSQTGIKQWFKKVEFA